MQEMNINKTIVPLLNKNWDKNDKELLHKLKIIISDSIYFKCLVKISPTYGESIINSILTSLEYKEYSKNETLLNYNEPVNNYYFILKGKLNIYKVSMEKAEQNLELISLMNDPKKEVKENKEEIFLYFNTYLKKYLKSIKVENIYMSNYKTIFKIEQDEIEETKNQRAHNYEELYKNIITSSKELDYSLNEGKIFGEEFLYNKMPFSNCILECGSDCIVGELNREEYDKIYKKFNKFERSFITVFLINLKLFQSSSNLFAKLQQCLIKRYYSKNEIIFNQGDKFHCFYLIRNGKVNLSLTIHKTVNCYLEPDIIMGKLKQERFTSNKSYITRGKYSENIDYNLITLQSGEFLGDIEYYEKNDKYLYTARCNEDCVLFEFDIELFEHFIINNHNFKDNLKGFYNKIKEKMIIFQERIYSIKMNNSAIKKTDYILSKNKFTKNILQGHPLKEDKKINIKLYNFTKSNSNKTKKIKDNESFYLNMISPFLKRYSSASKSKKFSKIQFNNKFFDNRNKNKVFIINQKANYKSKNINTYSYSSVDKTNISNRLLTEINEAQSTNRTLSKNIHLLIEQSNKEKKKNHQLSLKANCIPTIYHNSFRSNKNSKIFLNKNNTTENENEKLYDFMDANVLFSRNEKNKNIIPKILKSTKESKIYKERYNKDLIQKINDYYYKSPKAINN